MPKQISDCQVGETLVVSGYEKADPAYRQKLLSMGLTRGTEITVTKFAPMGDPVEVEVRGFKLSLRRAEASVLKLEELGHGN